jgi:hypothetical protein
METDKTKIIENQINDLKELKGLIQKSSKNKNIIKVIDKKIEALTDNEIITK